MPNFKGYSPIKKILKLNETSSGVTLHKVTDILDSGEIIHQTKFSLNKTNKNNIYKKIFSIYEPNNLRAGLNKMKLL